jgi:hypothetical protein
MRLPAPVAPTTEPKSRRIPPMNIVAHDPGLLPKVRDLYSLHPEATSLQPWELQSLLFSLGYSDGLLPEAEIAVAVEVARTDWMPDEGAA